MMAWKPSYPNNLAWSRVGYEEKEKGGVGGDKVVGGQLMGGEFILKAQIQKGVLNPQGF